MQRRRACYLAILVCGVVLGLLVSPLGAAPVVNNNSGSWFDAYNDALGVFNSNNVVNDPRAGIMQLAAGQAAGWYDTVLIRPTSFDAWQRVVVEAIFSSPADITVDILDQAETPIAGYQGLPLGPGGVVDIAGLNPVTYPALRVRINLTQGATAPVVSRLQVEWHPIAWLLLDKVGPAQVEAGRPIVYTVRYSVSFVRAQGLVVWDPLPTEAAGTVVYPQDYGQNDEPTFAWASGGGQYCALPGPCSVAGVSVPGNSVYWSLGDVPAGRTDALVFAVTSPNGALDGTLYRNTAYADATNAALAASSQVETVLTSSPTPGIDKRGGNGTVGILGKTWAGWAGGGRVVQFIVSDPMGGGGDGNACPRGVGCERMYNVVLYDNVSDLVGPPAKVIYTPGDPCSAFTNISGGGTCNPAYTPPAGGGPFPAIVWNLPPFGPGASYYQTFEVTLVDNPVPDQHLDNQACLDSDQTDPVCATLQVLVGMDDSNTGAFSKGDDLNGAITYFVRRNDDPLLYAHPEGLVTYALHCTNEGATIFNDTIMADIILPGTQFVAASLPPAANGRIFYATTAAYPDTHVPPPVDYVQAPADIDPVGSDNWFPYPPADPTAVTWIAFYIPQISPNWLPPNPISTVVGEYIVQVEPLADPCSGTMFTDWGQFYVFQHQNFGGGPITPIVPPLHAEDWEVTQVTVEVPELNVDPSLVRIEPGYVAPRETASYYLTVQNRDVPSSDTAFNTRAELQWSQVPVNGVPTYLDFISVSGGVVELLDPANGRVVLNLGTLVPGDSRNVELHLGVPVGVENNTEFSVQATVTAEDDECPVPPGVVTAYGWIGPATPQLQVVKDDVLDVIPGGGLLTYTLTFNGIGTAPSHDTFIVDRIPDRMVFLQATGPHGELVYVSNREPPDLPPDLLVTQTLSQADIAAYFTLATLHDNGTPGNPSDDWWTSPYGEATTWIAWLVDDPALGLFPVGVTHQVSLLTRNDEDRGAAQVDSVDGTLIFNEEGVFSRELLQAIGNEVITTIDETPGLALRKTGPDVVCSGAAFDWVVAYTNTSWVNDDVVTIRDTLPDGVTFLSASHTWNARALTNGADPGHNGQPVPSTVTTNPDGTTLVTFNIADPYRGGDLRSLEGGRITLHVQADGGLPSGTFLTNNACGEAANITGTISLCAEHTVEVRNSDLWLRKAADRTDPRAGDTVTWMLLLSNEDAHEAENVSLVDTLPAGMTYVPGSTRVWTAHYTLAEPSVSGPTLTWDVAHSNAIQDDRYNPARPGVLRPDSETVYISFQAVVNAGTPPGTTLTNNASVSTATCEDTAYANTANSSVETPFPDLALQKYGPETAYPGSVVTWRIRYRNANNEDALDSWVVDTLPDYSGDGVVDVTYLSTLAGPGPNGAVSIYWHAGPVAPRPTFDPLNPLGNGWVADPTGLVVTHIAYSVGGMPRLSGPYDLWVEVRLSDPVSGLPLPAGIVLTNYAEVFTLSTEERYDNNSDTATVRTPGLDLALEKTGSTEGAFPGLVPGDALSYEVVYRNLGTATAYGVKISDTLPAELTLQSPPDNFGTVVLLDETGARVTPVDPSGDPITAPIPVTRVQVGRQVTWYLGDLVGYGSPTYYRNVGMPSGAHGVFTIFAVVNLDVADNTAVWNPAEVITDRRNDAEPEEEYLGNNWDDSSVVIYTADVYVEKQVVDAATGSEQWTDAGSILTYTVWYGNAGRASAYDVVLDEVIPVGTTYISNSLVLPPDTRVTFLPDGTNPTQFRIEFLTPLLAPATYAWQGEGLPGWDMAKAERTQGNGPTYYRYAGGELSSIPMVGVVPFDANGDGALDIAYLDGMADGGGVLINDAAGNFASQPAGDLETVENSGCLTMVGADADADGDTDLMMCSGLLRNIGGGVFDLEPYNFGDVTAKLDFDNDGDMDLVMADRPTGSVVELYRNDGAGHFTKVTDPGQLDDYTLGYFSIEVGDVNNDGRTDVILYRLFDYGSGSRNYVFTNDGTGYYTLISAGSIDTEPNIQYLRVADINGDNNADLAVCRYETSGSSGKVLLGDGTGVFTRLYDGQVDDRWNQTGGNERADQCMTVEIEDVDRDGDQDVFFGLWPQGVLGQYHPNRMFLNNGLGYFSWWHGDGEFGTYVVDSKSSKRFVVFDANNDGWLDIVEENWGDASVLYLNAGVGECWHLGEDAPMLQLSIQPGLTTPQRSYDLVAFDADGDGDLDMVSSNLNATAVLYDNDGTGQFAPVEAGQLDDASQQTVPMLPLDVDGDGDTDVIKGNYNQLSALFKNDGVGSFTLVDAGQLDDATHYVWALAAADFDADGDLDVLMGNNNQASLLYENDGTGVFTQVDAGILDDTAYRTYGIAMADYDKDGDLDVALGNYNQSSLLFLNDGTGVFSGGTIINATAYNTNDIAAGDLNGDGWSDLVLGNYAYATGNTSKVFLNNGSSGGFTLLAEAGKLDDWPRPTYAVALFDADGDGDLDLATASDNPSGLASFPSEVYLNNGTGQFYDAPRTDFSNNAYGTQAPWGQGIEQFRLAVGDVDGDGDLDLLSSRYANAGEARSYYPPTVYINHGLGGMYETGMATLRPITPTLRYPSAGPLLAWDMLLVDQELGAGSITYDIINPATGAPIAGYTNVRPDSAGRISLAGLDPATYPALAVRANFAQADAGTLSDNLDESPQLCRAVVTFEMGNDPSFTFLVRVNDPVADGQVRVDNTAVIATSTPERDYSNNVATDTIWLRLTDLQVVKEVDKAAAMEGEPLLYTLQWRNNGPQPAPASWLSDTLPVGVAYTPGAATPPESALSGSGTAGDPYVLRWNLGDLAVGQEGTILIPVTINSGTAGQTLVNAAVVGTRRAETRYDNNYDDASTYVGTLANIWIEKTGPVWVLVGGRITYTLTYGNNGNSPAPNVVVSDTLPAGVTFVSATPPPDEVAGQVVRWTSIGTLNPGQGGTITMVGQVANDPTLVDTVLHNVVTIATTVQETTLADNADYWDSYVLLEPCRVSGYVWWDRDEDLIRGESNEPGLGGVTVQLLGTDYRGQPVSLSGQTDSTGFYIFSDLLPGTYYITETQPLNYFSVGAVVGTLGGSVYNPDRIISIPPKSGDVGVEYNFGENNAPTAVVITGFGAQAAPWGVWVRWETATERDNLGFNVYRSVDVQAVGEQLNGALIPSKSPGGDQGASYIYTDTLALPGVTYYYRLEDIDLGGHGTLHGPVTITVWRVYLPLVLAAY